MVMMTSNTVMLMLLALPACVLGASMPKSSSATAAAAKQTYPMGYKAHMNVPIKQSWVRTGPQELAKTYQKHAGTVPDHVANAAVASSQSSTSVGASPQSYYSLYLSSVQIGGQTFNMDFDPGSADLWVFSNLMPNSQSTNHDVYQTSASKQAQGLNWTIEYGDGTNAAGLVYLDTVSINGGTVQNQAVEAASNAAHNFVVNDGLDGLMGLGFSTLNQVLPRRQSTWFENIKDSLPAPLFAVDLRHQQPGSYDFGFIDNSKYTGALTYVNVDPTAGYWLFSVQGYTIESATSSSKTKRSIVSGVKSNFYNLVNRVGLTKLAPQPKRPPPSTSTASHSSTSAANHTSSTVKSLSHSTKSSVKPTGVNGPKPVHPTPKPSIRYTTTTMTTTDRLTVHSEATPHVDVVSLAKDFNAPQPYKVPQQNTFQTAAKEVPHPVAPSSTPHAIPEDIPRPNPHKGPTKSVPHAVPHGPTSVKHSTNIPKSTATVKTTVRPQAIPKPSKPVQAQAPTSTSIAHIVSAAAPAPPSSTPSPPSVPSSTSSLSISSPTPAASSGTFISSPFSAIADTGTSLMLLPSDIVNAYWASVPSGYYNNYYGAWLFTCSQASSLPSLSVRINGHDAVVPGTYINYGPLGYANDGTQICYGGLQDGGSFEYAILGDVFLKSVYAVFVDETSAVGGDPSQRTGQAMFGVATKSVPLY